MNIEERELLRTAFAMALAGGRKDPKNVETLWATTPEEHRGALLYLVCQVPSLVMKATALGEGKTVDAVEALEGIALSMASHNN